MSGTHDTRGILWHTIPATDYYPVKLIAWYFITNPSRQLISLQNYSIIELKHTSDSWQETAVTNTTQTVFREGQAQVTCLTFSGGLLGLKKSASFDCNIME
jgi:hypothetical protein